MGSTTATANRNKSRAATSSELMENIMTGGEISKKREKELAEAANRGRGIEFVETTGSVGNLKQFKRDASGKIMTDPKTGEPLTKAVLKTGATAADYTGRIVSSAPTISEVIGDAGRALFGGKAADDSAIRNQKLTNRPGDPTPTNYAQFMPKTKPVKGIVPSFISKGGAVGAIASSILSGKERKQKPPTVDEIYNQGVSNFANLTRFQLGGKNQKLGGD